MWLPVAASGPYSKHNVDVDDDNRVISRRLSGHGLWSQIKSDGVPLQATVRSLRAVGRMGWTDNRIRGTGVAMPGVDEVELAAGVDLVAVQISGRSNEYRAETFHPSKVVVQCLSDDAVVL